MSPNATRFISIFIFIYFYFFSVCVIQIRSDLSLWLSRLPRRALTKVRPSQEHHHFFNCWWKTRFRFRSKLEFPGHAGHLGIPSDSVVFARDSSHWIFICLFFFIFEKQNVSLQNWIVKALRALVCNDPIKYVYDYCLFSVNAQTWFA